MSKIRIAINGFGRIGRAVFKVLRERGDCEVVAINDLADNETVAYLLKHDSVYGVYGRSVTYDQAGIAVDGQVVRVLSEARPDKLPWDGMDIDVVVEATGKFTSTDRARDHIHAGAKKVVVTAALHDDGSYVILGANDDAIKTAGEVVSMGSCTANAVLPLLKIINDSFKVKSAFITNIHSYTNDQSLHDSAGGGSLRGRRGIENIIPIGSNVAKIVQQILPDIETIESSGYRIPLQAAALVELTAVLHEPVDSDTLRKTLVEATSQPYYRGIVSMTNEQLVSSDFVGNSHSAIVDGLLIRSIGDTVKVVAWYDSEWGYANRLAELAVEAVK